MFQCVNPHKNPQALHPHVGKWYQTPWCTCIYWIQPSTWAKLTLFLYLELNCASSSNPFSKPSLMQTVLIVTLVPLIESRLIPSASDQGCTKVDCKWIGSVPHPLVGRLRWIDVDWNVIIVTRGVHHMTQYAHFMEHLKWLCLYHGAQMWLEVCWTCPV